MRGGVFGLLPVLLAIISPAAKGEVTWLEKEYDFGLMKEEAGPKTGSVRLVNTGKEEISITGARPSCGCTGVAYPEDPIAPGDTVKFSFTYNPLGRPGRFEKSIRVYIGDFDMATIRIRGNVLGTPESLATLYPVEAGPLRLSDKFLPAGDVAYGSTRHFFLNGYNQTADTIRPSWVCADPSLSVSASSETIGPGDIITFSFYFNSRDNGMIGPVRIPVSISSDKAADAPQTEILFTANVKPDFSRMTPDEVEASPRCYLAPERVDLGEIPADAMKTAKLSFAARNEGKSTMRILRVLPHSETIRIKRHPSVVKPGKSDNIEGTIDIRNIPSGAFNLKIDVLTDDPLHPVRTVSVVGIKE